MEHHTVMNGVFFAVCFLVLTCTFQIISKRWSGLPYTAMLIIAGLLTQWLFNSAGVSAHIELSPDIIYFILLPLLLFESSFHISIHHFRLQFHTICALASVGLLISVLAIGGLLLLFTDLPVPTAFLFGAVISSTDPIAVIALFKQLGAPRRLGLVADGESMLNDATSVIVFKVVAALVFGSVSLSSSVLLSNTITFFWVFLASIIFGSLLGAITAFIASQLRSSLLAMNLLAISVALLSFVSAERFVGLSGVISTVSFGIVFGNLAVPLFDHHQESAFEHFWELVSVLCLSIVFFFSSLGVDLHALLGSASLWPAVIAALLIARAASVYIVCAFSNRLPLFRYEPKIPLSWQHVLNWGGLRGVIPLVLAYSLPLDYESRDLLISLTIACFLFTLLVNGFTIKPLLLFLKLHRPPQVHELHAAQTQLIASCEQLQRLEQVVSGSFNPEVLEERRQELLGEERRCLAVLTAEQSYEELLRSFRMAGNTLEREITRELFNKGYMSQEVLSAFTGQLDQQLDRIEYPNLPHRSSKKELSFDTSTSWRNRIAEALRLSPANRFLFWLFGASTERLVQGRFALLQIRLLSSHAAMEYFAALRRALAKAPLALKALDEIREQQERYIEKNRHELALLRRKFPDIIGAGQRQLLKAALLDDEVAHLPVG